MVIPAGIVAGAPRSYVHPRRNTRPTLVRLARLTYPHAELYRKATLIERYGPDQNVVDL
jgi:hypothetical protein